MKSTKGFTLIELLIVVVIIGILAAIAIPHYTSVKDKAYVASMKSDLRNLATLEESYYGDNGIYGTTTQLGTNYSSSPNVVISNMTTSQTGWSAQANNASTSKTCFVLVGPNDSGIVTCP